MLSHMGGSGSGIANAFQVSGLAWFVEEFGDPSDDELAGDVFGVSLTFCLLRSEPTLRTPLGRFGLPSASTRWYCRLPRLFITFPVAKSEVLFDGHVQLLLLCPRLGRPRSLHTEQFCVPAPFFCGIGKRVGAVREWVVRDHQ